MPHRPLARGVARPTPLALALLAAAAPAAAAQPSPAGPAHAFPQVSSVMTAEGPISVQRYAEHLERPWAIAFLPDGRALVTLRGGDLVIVDSTGRVSDPVGGTPTVYAQGQGGLLDVALDPDFATSPHVYLTFAMPGPDGSAATALGRGRWQGDSIAGFEVLFRQEPWVTGPNHFGSRIAFGPQGHLFVALGERFQFAPAQDLSNHLGTIVRLNRDGSIPQDNPFVGRQGAQAAIWSYGHRNIESAAVDPRTGALVVAEMGPLGGDELNVATAGRNYGWPVVSWGIDYTGHDIPDPPTRPELADAAAVWSPVLSPSGMVFYTGSLFPGWRGDAFIGGLSSMRLQRVRLADGRVTLQEGIPLGARIRDVAQGPDGALYVLTDEMDGKLWRIAPMPVRPDDGPGHPR